MELNGSRRSFLCLHISDTCGIFVVCEIVIEMKKVHLVFLLSLCVSLDGGQRHYFMEFWWRHGEESLYN